MTEPRRAIVELVLTRWRSFYREPGVLFWSFGFPILLAIALGIAFRNQPPQPAQVAVVDGAGAEAFVKQLSDSQDQDFAIVVLQLPPADADRALVSGKVDLLVLAGDPPVYRFDPSRPEARSARLLVDRALQRANGRRDAFEPRLQEVSEPGSRYIDFLIPGLMGVGLMQGGLWGVGYVIVDMRTRKLIKRLLATPMRKRDFLLAFVLVRALFLIVELPVLLGFATLAFDVPIRGSWILLTAMATLGSLAFAGLGVLIASRAENVQTASGLINLASLPMFMMSGTFFASSRFPDAAQPIIALLPLTALNDALRAIMLDGAGLDALWSEVAVLGAWGVLSVLLAMRIFRWK